MYYVTHKLYFSNRPSLVSYVVEVRQGKVVDLFPFERELQSMLWVDALFLSENDAMHGCRISDVTSVDNISVNLECLYYAYSVENGILHRL